jgi:uncharacterized protein YjiS (DUF1127 family)
LAALRYSQARCAFNWEREGVMIAVNLIRGDKAIVRSLKHLSGAFLGQLLVMANRPDPWRLFRRILDELRGRATMRELNLLSDHYLDDVGVRRSVDPRADDLVRRLRIGG